MKNTDIWIGRFDVKPRAGNDTLGYAKGAVVNVVGLASDQDAYMELVAAAMDAHNFEVLRFDDIARLASWKTKNSLHPELCRLADGLTIEEPIQFDEFQSYVSDDA